MTRRDRRKDREQERLDELLSAYLDGQLAEPERSRLEARLADDATLRSELKTMRHTVGLLGELPTVAVPRNFLLPRDSAAQARSVRRPITRRPLFAPMLTAATSVAALGFGIVLAGQLILSQTSDVAMAPAPGMTALPTTTLDGFDGLAATPAVTAAPSDDGGERTGVTPSPKATPTFEPGGGGGQPGVTPSPTPAASPVLGGDEGYGTTGTAEPPMPAQDEEPETAPMPTPASAGEGPDEGRLPVVGQSAAEDTGSDLGTESWTADLTPIWLWHTAEVCLGLAALVLGGASVWAWRQRRR